MKSAALRLLAVSAALAGSAFAWDAVGHRTVNQLALAALPDDFPAFVKDPAAAERIAFLANVPDRWRNVDPWLKQVGPSWTDHFLDIEQLPMAGLDPRTVSSFRYDFVVAFAAGRAAHPQNFPAFDPAKNTDHTREWPGFAPWAIAEWTQKLRSAFAYLKAFEEMGGTPEEIANAREDVIYTMGVLGHYVGDCAQPLHTTDSHNGWVGPNPNGYTTAKNLHSWIDGGIIAKTGINARDLRPRVTPATPLPPSTPPDGRDPLFVAAMDYVLQTHELVEPLYQMEKAGQLGGPAVEKDGVVVQAERPVAPEGRAFIENRLLAGGEMLAKLWITAWKTAPVDTYLRSQLAKRPAAAQLSPAPAPAPAAVSAADYHGPYWGSSKSTKYHNPNCEYAEKISAANKVVFNSKEEAVKAGYVPCGKCKP